MCACVRVCVCVCVLLEEHLRNVKVDSLRAHTLCSHHLVDCVLGGYCWLIISSSGLRKFKWTQVMYTLFLLWRLVLFQGGHSVVEYKRISRSLVSFTDGPLHYTFSARELNKIQTSLHRNGWILQPTMSRTYRAMLPGP